MKNQTADRTKPVTVRKLLSTHMTVQVDIVYYSVFPFGVEVAGGQH